MAGKLIEPKVITDFNNLPVAILPSGFYLDDDVWDKIWQRFEVKGSSLTLDDLVEMFPNDESLQPKKLVRTGEIDFSANK